MSQAYYPPPPAKPSSDMNIFGLIGLILSVLGFMTLIAAPIGLIFSLIGMRHEQKGLAIAGVIVGIFSTLYAATIAFIMFMYFGMIGTMCCFAANMVKEQSAQEQAAKAAVAPLLNKTPAEIEIHGLSIPPFNSSTQASGEAVYTDDAGARKVVDFTATFDKSSGTWTATNATLDSEPRDWVEFDFEDDGDDEDAEDETGDEESPEESPDENGNTGTVTTGDNQPINADAEATPGTP